MSSPRPLAPTHVHAGGLVLVAALTMAGYATIWRPAAEARATQAALQAELDEANAAANRLILDRGRLEHELDRVEKAINESAVRLEPVDRLNRRRARILALAAERNLVVDETQAGDPVTGERYDRIPVSINGVGTFPDCAAFLHHIATSMPDVEITSFELTGNPRLPGAKSAFHIDLSWFAAPALASAP